MPRRVPDISKVNRLVGFRPEMNLEGILRSVIDFHSGQQLREHPRTAVEAVGIT